MTSDCLPDSQCLIAFLIRHVAPFGVQHQPEATRSRVDGSSDPRAHDQPADRAEAAGRSSVMQTKCEMGRRREGSRGMCAFLLTHNCTPHVIACVTRPPQKRRQAFDYQPCVDCSLHAACALVMALVGRSGAHTIRPKGVGCYGGRTYSAGEFFLDSHCAHYPNPTRPPDFELRDIDKCGLGTPSIPLHTLTHMLCADQLLTRRPAGMQLAHAP